MTERNLPENGGKNTKLVTFDHALELVMVLPGKVAKEFRVKACDILKRYFAGDASLLPEIQANAASNAPINQMAREACANDNTADFARLGRQMRELQEQIVLGPVVKTQAALMQTMYTELKHEKHLRHQANGRYGSEIREANQAMKREATMFKDDRDRLLKQCEYKDKAMAAKDESMNKKDALMLTLVDRLLQRDRSPLPRN